MNQLTPHFSRDELTASNKARELKILNVITMEAIGNLPKLAQGLERVRELLGTPININSGYRCPALNRAVNGAKNSAHMKGIAADFTSPRFGSPLEIVKAIEASDIHFDKCIQEGNWVHISFAAPMRRIILTAHFDDVGKANYTVGV